MQVLGQRKGRVQCRIERSKFSTGYREGRVVQDREKEGSVGLRGEGMEVYRWREGMIVQDGEKEGFAVQDREKEWLCRMERRRKGSKGSRKEGQCRIVKRKGSVGQREGRVVQDGNEKESSNSTYFRSNFIYFRTQPILKRDRKIYLRSESTVFR